MNAVKYIVCLVFCIVIGSTFLTGCSAGSSCQNPCPTAGETTCQGDVLLSCMDNGSGCATWTEKETCQDGCKGGKCVDTQNCDTCTAGKKRCATDGKVQTCAKGNDGCAVWGQGDACPDTQSCTGAGVCKVGGCTNACKTGTKGCDTATNSSWECTLNATTTCYEKKLTACGTGQSCDSTTFACTCASLCNTIGEKRCNGMVIEECKDTNGCKGWSKVQDCHATNQSCVDSGATPQCSATCEDECQTEAEQKCAFLNAVVQECQKLDDGCKYWMEIDICFKLDCNASAGTAQCGSGCTDACSEDDGGCTNETTFWVCYDYNGDNCLEIMDIDCNQGETCVDGVCGGSGSCTDDDMEPNDTRSTAVSTLGGLITNLMICGGNDDWYEVATQMNETLVGVDLTYIASMGNIDVDITDDVGTVLERGRSTGDSESISTEVTGGDTYYVHVFGASADVENLYDMEIWFEGNADCTDVDGDQYGVGVDCLGSDCDDNDDTCYQGACCTSSCTNDTYEPNNTKSTAEPANLTTYSNLVICSGDDDWFVFSASADSTITITLMYTAADGNIDAEVTDISGTVLASGTSTSDFETIEAYAYDEDYYFVHIFGATSSVENTYDMEISNAK